MRGALLRRGREEVKHEIVEAGRRVDEDVGEARSGRRDEAGEDGDGGRADVRGAAGDHLEERRAERVEIGPLVDLAFAARLLGGHVRRGADDRAGAGELRVAGGGDAEVDELRNERLGDLVHVGRRADEEDVRRLDVAVDDAGGVGGGERFGDLRGDEERVGERQGRAAHALRDVFALEPFHRDVRHPLVELPERDDAHDARVVQPREHAPLAGEARLFAGVDARDGDDLQRDGLIGDAIVRAVHDADAAAADLALDREALGQEALERGRRHGARLPRPMTNSSKLRVPSGRIMRSSEKCVLSSARARRKSSPMKILPTKLPPTFTRLTATASARMKSSWLRAWSTKVLPVVRGAMSLKTTSYGA